MEARVDSRVPTEIKEKASEELAAYGLSILSSTRTTLSPVAKDGFPKYWGIPNVETMASIGEVADDMNDPKLKGASSFEELESMLNEQSSSNNSF